MGKLAERLSDPRRSGVYRIESTHAVAEAASRNGFSLTRIALRGVSGGALPRIAAEALGVRADGCVLVFSDFESLARSAPGAWQGFLAELAAAATARREAGERFFAAFLDPAAMLALAPLYNWQRSRSLREGP